MKPIQLEIPMALVPSRANEKSGATHWDRQRLVKQQRLVLRQALLTINSRRKDVQLPVDVLLTRIAPRVVDDDNVRHSLKAIRDELTVWLGLANDRDSRVRWEYVQDVDGRPRYHAIRFRIEPRRDCGNCGRPMITISALP